MLIKEWLSRTRTTVYSLLCFATIIVACTEVAANKVCAVPCFEAETARLYGSFKKVASSQASGGYYVTTPQPIEIDISDLTQLPDISQRVELPFRLEAGRYLLKVWVAARDDSDDSFYLRLDDGNYFTYHFSELRQRGLYPGFASDYVRHASAEPVVFEVDEGDHVLTFYLRETGARLDKIEFELVQD